MKKLILVALFIHLFVSVGLAKSMKTYYPNGKIQSEVSAEMTKMYYENGQVSIETPMENGEPAGVSKMYYESGRLMREENYAEKTWKQYNEDGSIQAEGTA